MKLESSLFVSHLFYVKCHVTNTHLQARPGTNEIPMREGDVVIVLSDEVDGFFSAEVEGRKGLVPARMVGEYTPKHPVRSKY